jgi:hypothetical protein
MVSFDVTLFFGRAVNVHGGLGFRTQEVWLGCHKQCTLHIVPPISRVYGRSLITSFRLPCGQPLEQDS